MAGAIKYAGSLAKGNLLERVQQELAGAKKVDWDGLLNRLQTLANTKKRIKRM